MMSYDNSFAREFYSLGTHSTDNVTMCSSPNQKSSLANSFSFSRGLPRLMIPIRFRAST